VLGINRQCPLERRFPLPDHSAKDRGQVTLNRVFGNRRDTRDGAVRMDTKTVMRACATPRSVRVRRVENAAGTDGN
jgi:hypothetical protein